MPSLNQTLLHSATKLMRSSCFSVIIGVFPRQLPRESQNSSRKVHIRLWCIAGLCLRRLVMDDPRISLNLPFRKQTIHI